MRRRAEIVQPQVVRHSGAFFRHTMAESDQDGLNLAESQVMSSYLVLLQQNWSFADAECSLRQPEKILKTSAG